MTPQGERVHNGYFCEQRGKAVDVNESNEGKNDDTQEMIRKASDAILKQKKRLITIDDKELAPLRFLFSVAALREGWDNPNIFQICTLTESDNENKRRQEVGRGMRLAVNRNLVRQDENELGKSGVHDVNVLTVIPSESYEDFVRRLQDETKEELSHRAFAVKVEFFDGRELVNAKGEKKVLDEDDADLIMSYLKANGYIDTKGNIMERYETAKENNTLAEIFNEELQEFATEIHAVIGTVVTDKQLAEMVRKAKANKDNIANIKVNKVNIDKKEFNELWNRIKQRFTYRVEFDSKALVAKAVEASKRRLRQTSELQVPKQLQTKHWKKLSKYQARSNSIRPRIGKKRIRYSHKGLLVLIRQTTP